MADPNASIQLIPRVAGRVGEITGPAELRGKFTFEVFLGFMGHGEPEHLFTGPAFATENEAHLELRKAVKLVCEALEKKLAGEASGKFIDLKDNVLKDWDESLKNSLH